MIFLQLFVGTRDGHLLMYGVTAKPGGGDHNVQLLRFSFFWANAANVKILQMLQMLQMLQEMLQMLQILQMLQMLQMLQVQQVLQ